MTVKELHPHKWVRRASTMPQSWLDEFNRLSPRWVCETCGRQLYIIELSASLVAEECPVAKALHEVMES